MEQTGPLFAVPTFKGADMSAFHIENGRATLICGQTRLATRYQLHVDIGGRAVMVELVDRPDGMSCGEVVQLVFDDGGVLECQVLDNTPMCTVVGGGLRRSG
jgi:hypothetical protein